MPFPLPRLRSRSWTAVGSALALAAVVIPAGQTDIVTADAATGKPRLLHGPQIYRLKPTGGQVGDSRELSYRYVIVFKLSRVTIGPTFEGDDEGDVQAGVFSLAGVDLPGYTHDRLYSRKYRPRNCVVAYFDQEGADEQDRRKLERIRIGQKVDVTLRPLASDNPNVRYGRTYHRRATMRQGSRYSLTERTVQRQLRDIGCQRRG